jgi:UDP-GlcNAc:undecaprenyl-phosphate GlcNAc-1-phosphate transferase
MKGISLLTCFYAFMTALSIALVLVPSLRNWALERGALDQPDERKVHTTAVPRLGGVAIFIAFIYSECVFAPELNDVRGFLAGSIIVFITGLIDDLHGLTPKRKFLGEFLACLVAVLMSPSYVFSLGNVFGFGEIILPVWLGLPLAVVAMVGVVNAVNLIDGLDGLAGGVSLLAFTGFFILGWSVQSAVAMIISATMVGGLLGFLKYNFFPARIFMGDAGSLTIGFILAFLAVTLTQHQESTISPVIPLLILGIPVLDTLRVMFTRIRAGKGPFSPDQNHVHHRLLALGIKQYIAVPIIYTICTFWVIFAIVGMGLPDYVLFYSFLVLNLCGYVMLMTFYPKGSVFMGLTVSTFAGIRSSELFKFLMNRVSVVIPLNKILLLAYGLLSVVDFYYEGRLLWQIPALFLVIGCLVRRYESRQSILVILIYSTLALSAFQLSGSRLSVVGISVSSVGDFIIYAVLLLSCLKLLFRKPSEYFLTTADFLILIVCVVFSVISSVGTFPMEINGVIVSSVVLLFGVRTILTQPGKAKRHLNYAMILLLAMFSLLGVW